jgi:Zn-dependent protease with chaperone function
VVGVRRRKYLVLGYPLWNVLDQEERLAVLAHEVAHDVNRDLRASVLIGTALFSLRKWLGLLSPSTRLARRRIGYGASGMGGALSLLEEIAPLVFVPLFVIVAFAGTALRGISDRSGQRAEYLADDLSYRIAGKSGTIGALTKLLVGSSCVIAIQSASRRGETDLWQLEREFMGSIPSYEFERRRRIAAEKLLTVDVSHPPTEFRIRLVESRPSIPCQAPLLAVRMAAIDQELEPRSNGVRKGFRTSRQG